MRHALAVLLLCSVACSNDDEHLPSVVWSGKYLDYAPSEDAEDLCAGTLPYMDRYLELAGETLNVSLDRVTCVLRSNGCDTDTYDAYACTDKRTIYTRHAPHEHELIHAARGTPGYRFFEEGEAQAFGEDDELSPDRVVALGSVREGIESCVQQPLADKWYPRAGHFLAYLHRYHGIDATSGLLRDVPRNASAEQAIAGLETATNMAFEDLIDDYEASEPFCDQARHYRYPLYPCNAPEALRPRCDGTNVVPIEVSLDCNAPTALGPRNDEIFSYVAINIPRDGDYQIKAKPIEGIIDPPAPDNLGRLEFKECALGCSSRTQPMPYRADVGYNFINTKVWLRAGRYSLQFKRNVDATELSTMSITIAGDDCQ